MKSRKFHKILQEHSDNIIKILSFISIAVATIAFLYILVCAMINRTQTVPIATLVMSYSFLAIAVFCFFLPILLDFIAEHFSRDHCKTRRRKLWLLTAKVRKSTWYGAFTI